MEYFSAHFWLYGAESSWIIPLAFCPSCDAEFRSELSPDSLAT